MPSFRRIGGITSSQTIFNERLLGEVRTEKERVFDYSRCIPLCSGPCSFSDCQKYYGRCIVANGTAQCICPSADKCSPVAGPICGDDGKTYPSSCLLEAQSCQMKKRVEVKDKKRCSKYCMTCLEKLDGRFPLSMLTCHNVKSFTKLF